MERQAPGVGSLQLSTSAGSLVDGPDYRFDVDGEARTTLRCPPSDAACRSFTVTALWVEKRVVTRRVLTGGSSTTPTPALVPRCAQTPGFESGVSFPSGTRISTGQPFALKPQGFVGPQYTSVWFVSERPVGSAAAVVAETFTADVAGRYQLSVCVTFGKQSALVSFSIEAIEGTTNAAEVIDAVLDPQRRRVLFVGANPNRFYSTDLQGGDVKSVDLPRAPATLDLSPDRSFSVVGHDGMISIISVTNPLPLLVSSRAVPLDVLDVVATNSHVYLFPRGSRHDKVYWTEVDAGSPVVYASTFFVYAGAVATLHPSGTRLYGADNGISPSDIRRFDLDGKGAIRTQTDSRYHGDYPFCGNIWISADGARAYSPCGTVVSLSENVANDMVYSGSLRGGFFRSVIDPGGGSRIVTLSRPGLGRSEGATTLAVYDRTSLQLVGEAHLPTVANGFKEPIQNYSLLYEAPTALVLSSSDAGTSFMAFDIERLPADAGP